MARADLARLVSRSRRCRRSRFDQAGDTSVGSSPAHTEGGHHVLDRDDPAAADEMDQFLVPVGVLLTGAEIDLNRKLSCCRGSHHSHDVDQAIWVRFFC